MRLPKIGVHSIEISSVRAPSQFPSRKSELLYLQTTEGLLNREALEMATQPGSGDLQ